jgi:RNA polymerase sigma-70 factor (ECF subfamily)
MASGDPVQPLEHYRDCVLMLARIQLHRALLAKVDASDVAQETLLKAHAKRDQFRGQTSGEMMAWLRAIIANTIAEAARRFGGPQRNVDLELALEQSSGRLEAWLADLQTGPEERAERNEGVLRLAHALAQLLEAERSAVELYHLHGQPYSEIGRMLGRTEFAVAGLLRRGVVKLRQLLDVSCEGFAEHRDETD